MVCILSVRQIVVDEVVFKCSEAGVDVAVDAPTGERVSITWTHYTGNHSSSTGAIKSMSVYQY